MTENQLKFLNYQESQRHNLQQEDVARVDAATRQKSAETDYMRANTDVARLAETVRSNRTSEVLKGVEIAERAIDNFFDRRIERKKIGNQMKKNVQDIALRLLPLFL